MSLLVDMMRDARDESYGDAAARRAGVARPGGSADGSQRPGGPRRRALLLVLLVLLGAVTGTAAAQVRRGEGAGRTARLQLVQEVREQTRLTDETARRVQGLRSTIAAERAAALGAGVAGRVLFGRVSELELVTGVVPLRGPGVVLTLEDAPGARSVPSARGGATAPGRVQDRDLQDAVNGLWAAGAEAISVNDLRLTVQTAIRSAGEAILVDFRPLSPPYVIRALGDRNRLQTGFVSGAAGGRLAALASLARVRFSLAGADDLRVVGSGVPDLRFVLVDPFS